jgi:hypothetical protein
MYALLFTLLFQGLAALAALCVVAAIVSKTPFLATSFSQALARVLWPIFRGVDTITPAVVPKALNPFIAAFWLLILRVGLYLGAGAYGLLPAVTS